MRYLIDWVLSKALGKFRNRKNTAEYWIGKLLDTGQKLVVQIGSNDGKSGDPIYNILNRNKSWECLFVEPVPYLFKRLKNNYPNDSRFKFENSAVNDGSEQIFYSVDPIAKQKIDNLPVWFDQLGSFDKNHIATRLDGILKPFIVDEKIQGITLGELFKKHNLRSINLLHIDAEGYDWKILSQLDFNSCQPEVILFEHKHLSSSEKDEAVQVLNIYYQMFEFGSDYVCVHRKKVTIRNFDKEYLKKYSIENQSI